jgi:imidazolonepropionase-like amidohydrolase
MRRALIVSVVLAALAVAVLASSCAPRHRSLVAIPDERPEVWLRDVRVFTGLDETLLEHRDVWISDGRIHEILPTGTREPPAGAATPKVSGLTVVPGLIDTHVHVMGTASPPWRFRRPDPEHNLEAWLYAGVTTVLDMGGPPRDLDRLAEKVATGELAGPTIVRGYLPFAAPGGHPVPAARALLPWPLSTIIVRMLPQPASEADALELVDEAHASGSTWVKIIVDELPPGSPRMDEAVLGAIVGEAHRLGLRAFVHIASNEDALMAIRAGADHLAHGIYKEAISGEVVAEARARGVSVTVTAWGFDATRRLAEGRYEASTLAREIASPVDEIDPVVGEEGARFGADPVLGPFARGIADTEILQANALQLYEAGVTVLAGSDSPIVGIVPGASLHEELCFLEDAGIPPAQVLLAATARAAQLVADAPEFGTIAAGQRADLLLVDGDPTTSVRALDRIVHVMARGRFIERHAP